jgi:hypothetical protein
VIAAAMLRRSVACLLLVASTACSDAADPDLMAEARTAVLDMLDDPSSARFDDTNLVALRDQGLVCGGRVKFRTERGEYTAFQPYYFHVGRGAALPGHDTALYPTLMRECGRALD